MDLNESQRPAVEAELRLLLESPSFRTSRRCRDFLQFVVSHTLDGHADLLKERSIGVELFELPPDFDAGQRTIVRVTANEVRKKLAQHYLAENGHPRAVRIELPTGSYRAEFRWDEPAAAAPAPPARSRWPYLAAALALLCGVALLLWWQPWTRGAAAAAKAPLAAPSGPELRLMVGSANPYVDRSGRAWSPDRYAQGGSLRTSPAERIFRTLDPDLYRHARHGNFQYDIPLAPGSYELHLHFAETWLGDSISAESSGEGQRLFHVSANGKRLLDLFDIVADAAGANIADERVFRDVSPASDGALHLAFTPFRGTAVVSAIELLPVAPHEVRPVRIRAGWPAAWRDAAGNAWQADSYFLGGNALVRPTNPANREASPDMAVYNSERWGHFSYSIPVAEGHYRLTLRFIEAHYGRANAGVGGVGSRVFDVYANGVALLRNFDIMKEAGVEGRPLDKVFRGVRPTAQGKIVITFVPVVGMACVNGIEVVAEQD